jgi:hypothetical protein
MSLLSLNNISLSLIPQIAEEPENQQQPASQDDGRNQVRQELEARALEDERRKQEAAIAHAREEEALRVQQRQLADAAAERQRRVYEQQARDQAQVQQRKVCVVYPAVLSSML